MDIPGRETHSLDRQPRERHQVHRRAEGAAGDRRARQVRGGLPPGMRRPLGRAAAPPPALGEARETGEARTRGPVRPAEPCPRILECAGALRVRLALHPGLRTPMLLPFSPQPPGAACRGGAGQGGPRADLRGAPKGSQAPTPRPGHRPEGAAAAGFAMRRLRRPLAEGRQRTPRCCEGGPPPKPRRRGVSPRREARVQVRSLLGERRQHGAVPSVARPRMQSVDEHRLDQSTSQR
mmetsp:Transcript_64653/g.200251  ORF Transcript_64653/g.200251 Transcript_64653/m.200251 type:complete len:236 (+) Transcript_64653:1185-1892(+)